MLTNKLFKLLCKGVSQRGAAFILNVNPKTIARRVIRFGVLAKTKILKYRKDLKTTDLLFDEMESFEHTKCKPLTIPIAVENKTRRILALKVGKIAAKGHLAEISKKKYGFRKCERKKSLDSMFQDLKDCCGSFTLFSSDESKHYPKQLKKHFPDSDKVAYKGKRGCVVGQGELKNTANDPLFSLNHSFAMIRDNVKRLSRKTWCTTKKPQILEHLLYIYAWFHNLRVDNLPVRLAN